MCPKGFEDVQATLATALAINNATAQNTITGIVQNKAENTILQADVRLINKTTGDTTKTRSGTSGFSINIPTGNYTLEAIANKHYIYRDTNFTVNKDTIKDLRMIRGLKEDSTNYLIADHPQFHGSFLHFMKTQLATLNYAFYYDVEHWPDSLRLLHVSGITGTSIDSLDDVTTAIEDGKNNIKYVKTTNDSTIGISLRGVPAGHDSLDGHIAYTYKDSIAIISENPLKREIRHVTIYITNDQGAISRWNFSRELLRAEGQTNRSLYQYHVLVNPGTVSFAPTVHQDEINLSNVNQKLLTREDWRNYIDSIGTIIEIPEDTTLIVQYAE